MVNVYLVCKNSKWLHLLNVNTDTHRTIFLREINRKIDEREDIDYEIVQIVHKKLLQNVQKPPFIQ